MSSSNVRTRGLLYDLVAYACRSFLVVFRIYDVRNDGYITADELYEILKTMVGNHLTDKQLMEIAEQTVQEADLDKDGKISFDEFCQVRRTHRAGRARCSH